MPLLFKSLPLPEGRERTVKSVSQAATGDKLPWERQGGERGSPARVYPECVLPGL